MFRFGRVLLGSAVAFGAALFWSQGILGAELHEEGTGQPVVRMAQGPASSVSVSRPALANGLSLREWVDVAVAKVKPALVRVHVVSTDYIQGREVRYQSSGSGVIITQEGHVVTNHHVAGDATRLVCTMSNREELEAELVGTDALTDIAVIRLLPETPRAFPFAAFGDSSGIRVGDHVMSMGSPRALSQSVTLGIISNTAMVMPRRMSFGSLKLDGENVGALVRWIMHDAVIYGGNSGGPLVNLAGEIIGINEISMGLGGAIPGNLAREVAETLIQDGRIRRSWVGVMVRPLLKHGEAKRGVLVTGTISGSPAADAGFESGDILVSFAGEEIQVRFDEDLPDFNRLVAGLSIGSRVEAVVVRDGERVTLSVETVEREKMRPKQRELKQWGVTVRDISFVMSKEMKRPSTEGVAVTSVRPGGPAGEAKPQLRRNDVIVEVGGIPINNVADLVRATKEVTRGASKPVPVLTTFERKAASQVTVVKVGIRELNDPGLEVKKAWLSVDTQVITRDIADEMGRPELTGFRVTRVYAGGTAEEAGLKTGDLVLAVDGEKLTARAPEDYEELPTLIRAYKVGSVAELAIERNGEALTVPVELVRSPKLSREMRKYRDEDFEFTVREITFFDRAEERWDEEQYGVLVDEVKPGSWAALGLLYVGDLIREVGGEAIRDTDSMREAMAEVMASKPASVVFEVLRGIYTVYIELEPKWD